MRFIQLHKAADLQALTKKISGNAATLAQAQKLNPHLDLNKLAPGSVLLLPDSAELGDGKALATDSWDDFQARATSSLSALNQRARSQVETLKTERQGLTTLFKSAALKRLQDADPALKKQLDAAGEQASADQKAAETAAAQLEEMQKLLGGELGRLGKLLA
ncbi:hypothetical protein HNP55_001423 [Paucibacter oligotrophus]|uniref:Uncharacterized protein n=1 Tax=Roseateles oligotrophus TaxID=1769250 RepID=A0A840L9N9_9BURK|nr:hypothetical protein [Roseateles oligotrophus]MBB4842908.1 hypothetical protein [Roseateles oligotrophus]